jgi:hypothetical protein
MDRSVPGYRIEWSLHSKSLDDALKMLEDFKLDGVVQRMRCLFLAIHGEDSTQDPRGGRAGAPPISRLEGQNAQGLQGPQGWRAALPA